MGSKTLLDVGTSEIGGGGGYFLPVSSSLRQSLPLRKTLLFTAFPCLIGYHVVAFKRKQYVGLIVG